MKIILYALFHEKNSLRLEVETLLKLRNMKVEESLTKLSCLNFMSLDQGIIRES